MLNQTQESMNTVKNIAIKSLLQGIGITAVLILFTNVFYSQTITSSERGTVTYRIIAHKANETAIVSTSNTANLKKSTSLFMPTAFTPDSDGINDQFGAKEINVRDFHLEVFNRWGEKIFESTDINTHWDGTYQGSAAQQGSYVYNMTAYDMETNENISSAGTVALLR